MYIQILNLFRFPQASFDLLYLVLSLTIFAAPKLSEWYTAAVLPHVMPIG